jgi:hypothetical protein
MVERVIRQYLTHRFVKIRQREGSGVAKKLEEPIATAPSGLFIYDQAFSDLWTSAIIMFLMPDAITAL